MKKLKVRKIGNSLGVVLPKELLAELGVGEGDELVATSAQDGILVGSRSKKFERTMEIAERGMKKYRNTLRELAK